MSILRLFFELFVLYLVYKLVFDFLIPVYQATKQVKQKMGEMQHKMNEHMKQQPGGAGFNATAKEPQQKPGKEDYIEYEEVK